MRIGAEKMKNWREISGLSQIGLAEKLDVRAQFVSNWERGKSCIPPRLAKKFCSVTGAKLSEVKALLVSEYDAKISRYFKMAAPKKKVQRKH